MGGHKLSGPPSPPTLVYSIYRSLFRRLDDIIAFDLQELRAIDGGRRGKRDFE